MNAMNTILTYAVIIVAANDCLFACSGVLTCMAWIHVMLEFVLNRKGELNYHLPPFPLLLQQYGLPPEQAFT
jgi:hypothetical protein